MNYQERDTHGMYASQSAGSDGPQLMGAHTLQGNPVLNRRGEALTELKDIVLDMHTGRVLFAVMSIGGFMGMGEQLFAVPWSALKIDATRKCFILDVEKDRLTGHTFEKDHWPDMTDPAWVKQVRDFYRQYTPLGAPS